MIDQPVSPHRRSSPLPPPYPPLSPSSPLHSSFKQSHPSTISSSSMVPVNSSGSGSGSSGTTSSSTMNKTIATTSTSTTPPTLPCYSPSTQSQPRRRSSQSDFPSSSSSRSSMSTAPTEPGLTQRQWRPTPHVPPTLAHRHRHRTRGAASGIDDEERNRWLSEDEGLEGVSSSIGRRRRRSSDEIPVSTNDSIQPPPPPISSIDQPKPTIPPDRHVDPIPGPGPSTQQRRFEEKQALLQSLASKSDRPQVRRARSFEPSRPIDPPSNIGATDITVGNQPPRIQDIIPERSTQVFGLGITQPPNAMPPGIEAMSSGLGQVPDFAPGRGGDGIGGVGAPTGGTGADINDATARAASQGDLLEKLYRTLGCALCPTDRGVMKPLHHPITLPCGHTISSSHISIPAPAPLRLDPSLPAHEVFSLQQRQHQQRLNLWAGVMCPVPSCKRYSPSVSTLPVNESPVLSAHSLPGPTHRAGTLPSGVAYYPPPPPAPPAYSAEAPVSEVGSPLLDISVDKILHLVLHEMKVRKDNVAKHTVANETDTEESGEEGLERPQDSTGLSQDLSRLGNTVSSAGPSSPLARRSSKRQRNTFRNHPRQRPDGPAGSSEEWPFRKELLSVVECDVCAMMLHEPVTTPCQHSFCSKCLSRSLDHSTRCPLCRQDLPSFAFFQDHAVNRVLLTIIKTAFPEEYAERCASIERDQRDGQLDTPIFVCTLAFPGMPTILHVFEPRYRLMIRRCIESSNPRFGMVLPSRANQPGAGGGGGRIQGVMEYGTMLEIQSVQMLPDGRSMVETVGTHRFKLLEKGNLDGYTVGRIERIDDISPEEDAQLLESAMRNIALRGSSSNTPAPPEPAPIHPINMSTASGPGGMPMIIPGPMPQDDDTQTTDDYMRICRSFIEQLRSGSAPWLLQRLNNTYGTMPTDPSEFSYWMALVMPIDEYEKARLLPIRSPRLRLKLIVHWVESLRSSWWFSSGCVVG